MLKNFPTAAEVEAAVATAGGEAIEVTELEHYWYASYTAGSRAG